MKIYLVVDLFLKRDTSSFFIILQYQHSHETDSYNKIMSLESLSRSFLQFWALDTGECTAFFNAIPVLEKRT